MGHDNPVPQILQGLRGENVNTEIVLQIYGDGHMEIMRPVAIGAVLRMLGVAMRQFEGMTIAPATLPAVEAEHESNPGTAG